MIARGEGGHVVNTASMAGLIASQGLGVYNTSKYAVVGLSETLAKDLRPHGIGVTVVCPMGVATRIRAADRNRPAGAAKRAGCAGPGRRDADRSNAGPRRGGRAGRWRPSGAGELYVITHDEAHRAAASPIPASGGGGPDDVRKFDTDAGARYPEPGVVMDERDVVRDLVAKLIEAVEASLDGSAAVREALDELVRSGYEPRIILLADAAAAREPAPTRRRRPPLTTPRRRTTVRTPRGAGGRCRRGGFRGGAGSPLRADEARPRLPADGAHPVGGRVAVVSAASPRRRDPLPRPRRPRLPAVPGPSGEPARVPARPSRGQPDRAEAARRAGRARQGSHLRDVHPAAQGDLPGKRPGGPLLLQRGLRRQVRRALVTAAALGSPPARPGSPAALSRRSADVRRCGSGPAPGRERARPGAPAPPPSPRSAPA